MASEGLDIQSVRPLGFGTSSSTYLLTSPDTCYVLKLFDSARKAEICKEIFNLRKLSSIAPLAILPLNKTPLTVSDFVGYYYPYFDGEMMHMLHIPNIYLQFGILAGQFDLAAQSLPFHRHLLQKSSLYSLLCSVPTFKTNDPTTNALIVQATDSIRERVDAINPDSLRLQYIHKDLHFHNVLYQVHSKHFFIIDTTGLSVNFLPRELAVIIGNSLKAGLTHHAQEAIRAVLRGYRLSIHLTREEIIAIPFFILQKKIGELEFLHNQFEHRRISREVHRQYVVESSQALDYTLSNYSQIVNFLLSLSRHLVEESL